MSKSKIEWTDRVWNPVTGCTKVSPGCANCYAERMAKRLRGRCGYPQDEPFSVTFHKEKIMEPFRWKSPSKVFVCSMSDLFIADFEYGGWIDQVIETIKFTPKHTYIILTKRPARAFEYFKNKSVPKNVWLGVSAENQQTANERIPILFQIPSAVRFVSCEPLLGPINLCGIQSESIAFSALEKGLLVPEKLDWVIAGGESGPGARPMHPDWARSLRDQCQAAGVPFFFKQWGEWGIHNLDWGAKKHMVIHEGWPTMSKVGKKAAGRLLDGKEYNEFPSLKSNF